MGIAQLVSHTAGKSILCMRVGDAALPKLLWYFLFNCPYFVSYSIVVTVIFANINFGTLCLQEIIQRTGYSHEVTPGQRKYGGPPPGWNGPPPGPGHEVRCLKLVFSAITFCTYYI